MAIYTYTLRLRLQVPSIAIYPNRSHWGDLGRGRNIYLPKSFPESDLVVLPNSSPGAVWVGSMPYLPKLHIQKKCIFVFYISFTNLFNSSLGDDTRYILKTSLRDDKYTKLILKGR